MSRAAPASAQLEPDPAQPEGAAPGARFRWPEQRPGEPPSLPPATPRALRWLPWALTALGVGAAAAVYFMPAPDGLSPAGQGAWAVFLVCATLWVTDVLPIGVTGLLAVALLALTGATPGDAAFAAFGNSAVFFILGVFILAAAIIHSGLSKRLALVFLSRFQRSPFHLASGIMLTAGFLTVWMPAQATAAMLFPIVLELAQVMRLEKGTSRYAKVLFLALAWGAMVGSNASFLGSTRAPLALGIMERTYGRTITFGQWLLASTPLVLLGMAVGLLVLRAAMRWEAVDLGAARASIDDSVAKLGRMGWLQARVALILGLTICAWVFFAARVDLAVTALLGAVALFATRAVQWKDLDGYVNWGIVLMYGGAIALGGAVESSGAAEWLVRSHVAGLALSPFMAVAGLALITVILTEFMSNAAAVAAVLPLGFGFAEQFGLSPATVVLTCSLAAGLDFTFPFSSAPSSIVYAGGYLRMRDMLVLGSVMTGLQVLLLLLVSRLYWPLIGVL